MPRHLTVFKLATYCSPTDRPVLLTLLICKRSGAILTAKLGSIEGLHSKAIDLVTKPNHAAASGAGIVLCTPLSETIFTAKLVAAEALLGRLYDLDANRAGEVLVNLAINGLSL